MLARLASHLSVVLSLAALLAPSAAWGQTHVAVLPFQHDAKVSEAQAETLVDAVRATLAAGGKTVLAKDKSRRLAHNRAAPCTSKKCLDGLVALCDAPVLVGGRIAPDGKDGWLLQMWRYDSKQQDKGKPMRVATQQQRCSACRSPRGAAALAKLAVAALQKKSRALGAPGYVSVQSTPQGATVRIDGVAMGLTNMTFGLTPGRHVITIERRGYKLSMREVDVEARALGKVHATLEKAGDDGGKVDGKPSRTLRLLGWIAVGVGVVTLGVGVTMWAIGPSDAEPGAGGVEPAQVTSLRAPGIALTVAGGALAIGGIVALIMDARRASGGSNANDGSARNGLTRARWSASVGPGHAFVGFQTRF